MKEPSKEELEAAIQRHVERSARNVAKIPANQRTIISKFEPNIVCVDVVDGVKYMIKETIPTKGISSKVIEQDYGISKEVQMGLGLINSYVRAKAIEQIEKMGVEKFIKYRQDHMLDRILALREGGVARESMVDLWNKAGFEMQI